MFGFAPITGGPPDRDEALRDFLFERKGEFIVQVADGTLQIVEAQLDRLVMEFLRSRNALH